MLFLFILFLNFKEKTKLQSGGHSSPRRLAGEKKNKLEKVFELYGLVGILGVSKL